MNFEPKRIFLAFIGFFLLAVAVALSIHSHLGTAVVSCVPYVYSLITGLTMGTCVIIFHSLFMIPQILILKKDFPPIQFLQIPIVFIFGKMNNFTISGFERLGWIPKTIGGQFAFLILSAIVIAIALILIIRANFIMMPLEALTRVIAVKRNVPTGKVKRSLDILLVIIAVVSSMIYFGKIHGVGVGTLIVALSVGTIMEFLEEKTNFPKSIDHFLNSESTH